jgi:hypothetical protein
MHTENELSKVFGAYSTVRAILKEYRFKPGEHIQVNTLSEQLRFSVTPIREALAPLWIEQLVDCVPNRGFYVKPIDLVEQSLLIDAKTVISRHGISSAKGPATDIHVNEEGTLNDQIENVYSRISEMTLNAEFQRNIDNYNARSFIIRKIDCDLFQGDNVIFIHDINDEFLNGNRNSAIRIVTQQLQRISKNLPLLTKEAVSRVALKGANSRFGFHGYAYARKSEFLTNTRR